MKRWIFRIGGVVLSVVAALLLRPVLFPERPVPVTVFYAAMGRVEATVANSKAGTLRSRLRASLSPEIGGRVVRIEAREGEPVRAGGVVLALDDSELRARADLEEKAVLAAKAARSESCERADQAERDLQRYIELAADNSVSAAVVDRARTERDAARARCDAAQADVQRAEAALRLARVQLAKAEVRAPFDGVVSELATEVGEWVTPSPPGVPIPPVLEILQPADVYVRAPLDEVDAGRVRPSLPVRIHLEAYPDASFTGTVRRVADFVRDSEAQNRTFDVDVEFGDQRPPVSPPGMSADVEVILEVRENVLRVPAYALIEGRRVLVVRDGRLVETAVEVGLKNWEFAEIRSGLTGGDPVVVSLDRAEVKAGALAEVEAVTER